MTSCWLGDRMLKIISLNEKLRAGIAKWWILIICNSLFIAALEGCIGLVKELLNQNADIETIDEYGMSPLILGLFKNY